MNGVIKHKASYLETGFFIKAALFVISIILTLLIAYEVANIIIKALAEPKTSPAVNPVKPTPDENDELAVSFQPSALFGVARVSDNNKAPSSGEEVVESDLNLKLLGVVVSEWKKVALISHNGAKARAYVPGDEVIAGAVLAVIEPEYVVLRHNGKRKKVNIEKHKSGELMRLQTAGVGKTTVPPLQNTAPPSKSLRKRIYSYKKQLGKNPLALSSLLVAKPRMKNGVLAGMVVSPGSDREFFNYTGLKKGDTVISINNIPVNDFSELSRLQHSISTEGNNAVTIQIKRKGVHKELLVNLNP